MLHSITSDGTMTWHCQNAACGAPLNAHISHEAVQWHPGGVVALPMCQCGTQMFVRATFSAKELQYPTLTLDAHGTIQSVTIPEGLPPNFVVLDIDESDPRQPRIRGVSQHPAIARHLSLAQQLRKAGKLPLEEQAIV